MGSDGPSWTDVEQIEEPMQEVIGVSDVLNLRLTDDTSLFAKDLPDQVFNILIIALIILLVLGLIIFILRKFKHGDDL
jgi:hypothetical protein